MQGRLRASLAALQLVLAGVPCLAQASAPTTSVEVRCPALMPGSEAAAALEARVLLELSVRGQGGALLVECAEPTVTVVWRPHSGLPRTVRLNSLPSETLADRVISSLDELTAQPEPIPAPPPPPQPAPPRPAPPQLAFGLSSGALAEWWDSTEGASLGLALGPALGGSRFRTSLQAAMQRRISKGDLGLTLSAYRGRWMFDYALLPSELRLELGAGATAGLFRATMPAAYSPSAQSVFALAVDSRLRVAWHSPRISVALGPHASLHVVRPSITLPGRELPSVTAVSAGLSGDVYFWF